MELLCTSTKAHVHINNLAAVFSSALLVTPRQRTSLLGRLVYNRNPGCFDIHSSSSSGVIRREASVK